MTADQLDLFGEVEAQEDRAARMDAWYANPQTCNQCGRTEPGGYLLGNNHGGSWDRPAQYAGRDECLAMYLTRNHVLWAASTRKPEHLATWGQPRLEHLERNLARAREVWANRLDDLNASLAEHGLDPDGRPLA